MWVEHNSIGDGNFVSYNHTPSFAAKAAYFYVQGVGHYNCDENFYTKREGYKSFLLICSLNGKGYAKYRGKEYELSGNKVLCINCYDYQEYFADNEELWEIKWLHFNGAGSEGYFNIIYENYGPVFELSGIDTIVAQIDEIMRLIKDSDKQLEIKVSEIIVRILTQIMLDASGKSSDSRNDKSSLLMKNVIEYLEQNHASNITIKEMAGVACSSIYHFIRIFKRYTGFSPYEYLIKYRINSSKTLLISTDLTIDEIAERVGFASTSNFIKTFRELEEITPLKYRKFWKVNSTTN